MVRPAGKVDNCQVGVFLAYVTRTEHTLVNARLYLPKSGPRTGRSKAAGVPKTIRFQTRQQLALEMLEEGGGTCRTPGSRATTRWAVPAFSAGFACPGRTLSAGSPSNTLIRDLDTPPPEYSGRGRYPKNPFTRVDDWCSMLPEGAWTTIDVRDGEKGPLVIEAVKRRVQRGPTGWFWAGRDAVCDSGTASGSDIQI